MDTIKTLTTESGVYCLRLLNRKHYVGSTINIRQRIQEHLRTLQSGAHHSKRLQRSWEKYGKSGLEVFVLERCSIDRLFEREQFWIDCLMAATHKHGLNMLPNAGTVKGHKASEEARRKMSVARKGKKRKPHTAEAISKMSVAHSGKVLSQSHIESMRKAATGRKHSPESIEKMRRVQKGRAVTEKMRATRSAMNREEQSYLRLKKHLEYSGLQSPNQKLSPEMVSEAALMAASGIRTGEIASRFGVNRSTIYRALRGITAHKR